MMTNVTTAALASFDTGHQEIIGAIALLLAALGLLICALHLASYCKSIAVATNPGDVVLGGWIIACFMTAACVVAVLSQSFVTSELSSSACTIEAFILSCAMLLQSLTAAARPLILLFKISGTYVFDTKSAWFMTLAIYIFAIVWTAFFSLGSAPNIDFGDGLFCFINLYEQNGIGVLWMATAATVVQVFESEAIYSAARAQIIRSRVNASVAISYESPFVSDSDSNEVKKLEHENISVPDLTDTDRQYLARLFLRMSTFAGLSSLPILTGLAVQWCGIGAPIGIDIAFFFSLLLPSALAPVFFARFIPAHRHQFAALLGIFGRRYSTSDSNSHSQNESDGGGVNVDQKDAKKKSVDEGEALPNGLFIKMTFVPSLGTSIPVVSRLTVWRMLDWEFGMDLARDFEATHEPKLHVPELIEFLIRVKKFATITNENKSAPNIGWALAKKIIEEFIHEKAPRRVNFSATLYAILIDKFVAESTTVAPTGIEFDPAV